MRSDGVVPQDRGSGIGDQRKKSKISDFKFQVANPEAELRGTRGKRRCDTRARGWGAGGLLRQSKDFTAEARRARRSRRELVVEMQEAYGRETRVTRNERGAYY